MLIEDHSSSLCNELVTNRFDGKESNYHLFKVLSLFFFSSLAQHSSAKDSS